MTKAIEAKNLTAQVQYRAAGNPPSTLPASASSNCFPGLEIDFRTVWTRLFVGIELHESSNFVVGVEADAPPEVQELANGYLLTNVSGAQITAPVIGPKTPGGPDEPLTNWMGDTRTALEWSNALATIVQQPAGSQALCVFESLDGKRQVSLSLTIRSFFDEIDVAGQRERRPAIARELAPPGALTQSLCAPWQYDYRYCACFYWAATRPDYVNVEPRTDGTSAGNNWLEKDRTRESVKTYILDDFQDARLITIQELIAGWERSLRFVRGGNDE
jgi:hypothetical protein